jgi:hypothetical protein
MHPRKLFRGFVGCCLAALLAGAARPQQRPSAPARPATDIVKDNLDRVAATPEQILEVLYKDSGLMVEFKQLLAQDAGTSGQIVEESDLSDAAIADRLRQDLRTRVLATRLLRRYGYLLPRVNPDSDLAVEHNLVLRERAKQIERASEPRDTAATQPPVERTRACDPQPSSPCPPSQRTLEDPPLETLPPDEILTPEERRPAQGSFARPPLRTAEETPQGGSPADGWTAAAELGGGSPQPGSQNRSGQARLTSALQANPGSGNS